MVKNKKESKSTHRAQPQKQKSLSGVYLLLLACIAVTLICYLPSLTNGWTNWDDEGYVLDNNLTKSLSFATLPQFFSTFQMGNYHPLPMLSLALDYKWFGTNATGFHIHSVLLHLINVVLVFFFVWQLTKKRWATVITALFFGIHPAHIESVSWISERKDLLYVLYYMAALIAYLKYVQSGKKISFLILSVLLFILSLLSKGQAVTLSVILLLIDYYLKRPFHVKLLIEKVPFFILSLLFGIIAVFAQQHAKAINEIPYYSFADRLVFSADSLFTYFYKALLPLKLSAFYPYPRIVDGHYSWIIFLSPVIVLALFGLVIYSMKFTRLVAFGFAFYLANVILILQILPVGGAMMADRYTYLAYTGLFFIAGMFVQYLTENNYPKLSSLKAPVTVLVVVCGLFFSIKTYSRNHIWKSSETLYLDMIENYDYIPVANNNLGNYYNKQGKPELALRYFSKAISLQPDYKEALINRSDIYRQQGKIDSAIADCDHVLQFEKDFSGAYMNRGIALCIAGRFDSAMNDFNTVLRMDSTNSKAYGNRGNLFDMKGKYDSAIADYNRAVRLDPNYTDVYGNRGRSYLHKGMADEAIKDLTSAIKLQPDNPEYYTLRSDAYNLKGDFQQALDDAVTAQQKGKSVNPVYIEMLKQKIGNR